jgi:hypothetical protein
MSKFAQILSYELDLWALRGLWTRQGKFEDRGQVLCIITIFQHKANVVALKVSFDQWHYCHMTQGLDRLVNANDLHFSLQQVEIEVETEKMKENCMKFFPKSSVSTSCWGTV